MDKLCHLRTRNKFTIIIWITSYITSICTLSYITWTIYIITLGHGLQSHNPVHIFQQNFRLHIPLHLLHNYLLRDKDKNYNCHLDFFQQKCHLDNEVNQVNNSHHHWTRNKFTIIIWITTHKTSISTNFYILWTIYIICGTWNKITIIVWITTYIISIRAFLNILWTLRIRFPDNSRIHNCYMDHDLHNFHLNTILHLVGNLHHLQDMVRIYNRHLDHDLQMFHLNISFVLRTYYNSICWSWCRSLLCDR